MMEVKVLSENNDLVLIEEIQKFWNKALLLWKCDTFMLLFSDLSYYKLGKKQQEGVQNFK